MRDNVIPKFRAFLIEDKTMRDVVEIDFVKNMYCLQIGRSTIGEWFWYRDLFLMQSTGLKDKNGVEIYEGDVVSMVVFEDKAEYLGDVVFEYGCFYLNISLDGTKYKVTALDWKETETIITVIGDIYQNKDLLEG